MTALKYASPDFKKKDDHLYVKQNTEKINCICRSRFREVLEVTLLIFFLRITLKWPFAH